MPRHRNDSLIFVLTTSLAVGSGQDNNGSLCTMWLAGHAVLSYPAVTCRKVKTLWGIHVVTQLVISVESREQSVHVFFNVWVV